MQVPPAPQKSPIIVALFHAYRFPPYWSASRSWIAAGAKSVNPKISNLSMIVRNTEPLSDLVELLGIRINASRIATNPPMGKLI